MYDEVTWFEMEMRSWFRFHVISHVIFPPVISVSHALKPPKSHPKSAQKPVETSFVKSVRIWVDSIPYLGMNRIDSIFGPRDFRVEMKAFVGRQNVESFMEMINMYEPERTWWTNLNMKMISVYKPGLTWWTNSKDGRTD